jgi:hypothetical protein
MVNIKNIVEDSIFLKKVIKRFMSMNFFSYVLPLHSLFAH